MQRSWAAQLQNKKNKLDKLESMKNKAMKQLMKHQKSIIYKSRDASKDFKRVG